jgi:hypothetical protein
MIKYIFLFSILLLFIRCSNECDKVENKKFHHTHKVLWLIPMGESLIPIELDEDCCKQHKIK